MLRKDSESTVWSIPTSSSQTIMSRKVRAMRALSFLATIMLLGITALFGGQAPAVAQDEPNKEFKIITSVDVPWERVSRPRPVSENKPVGGAGTSPIEKIQQYEVFFDEEAAAVPVVENAEFMLVAVQQGTFVLDLAPANTEERSPVGAFLVHPSGGESIPTMTRTDYPEPGPHYIATGANVLDASGTADCTSMCVIPAAVAVQVKPGDRIVAREGAICLWCLLNQTAEEGDEKGLLLVSPVISVTAETEGFSWIQAWDNTVSSYNAQTRTVRIGSEGTESMSGEPVKMGWALFNPGTSCKA
jgi:hypothetical protein